MYSSRQCLGLGLSLKKLGMAVSDGCVIEFGDRGGGVESFAAESFGVVGAVFVVVIVVVVVEEEEGGVSGGFGVVAAELALVLLSNRAGARPGRRGSDQIESIDR